MGIGTLSSKVAFLDKLLGIVPGSAGIGHENSQDESAAEASYQKPKYT